MVKKIGHDYNRDPYPWDDSEKGASAVHWTCCDMNLPKTFYICPMCERERDITTVEIV
ncbi:MAG: hypothetical protein WCK54_06535 [Desulfuromonadales bacterium]